MRARQQRLERLQLGRIGLHRTDVSRLIHPRSQDLVHLLEIAPAQVMPLLGDHHVVRPGAGEKAQAVQDLLGPVAGRADPQPHLPPPAT